MHELGVVFHIIDTLKDVAKENELTKIRTVTLQLGEVSTVIPMYLKDCWRWAADREELLKGAELDIEMIPAQTFCEDCKQLYSTVKHGKICPNCGSAHTYLYQGNEFLIKQVEGG